MVVGNPGDVTVGPLMIYDQPTAIGEAPNFVTGQSTDTTQSPPLLYPQPTGIGEAPNFVVGQSTDPVTSPPLLYPTPAGETFQFADQAFVPGPDTTTHFNSENVFLGT